MEPNAGLADFEYPEDGVQIEAAKYPMLTRKLQAMRDQQDLELSPAASLRCLYEAVEYLSLQVEAMNLHDKDIFIVIGASRTGKGTLLAAL